MKQDQLFSAILQNVHDGIIAVDNEMKINFVNPAAMRMSAWTAKPLGKTAQSVFTLFEPRTLNKLLQANLPKDKGAQVFKEAVYKSGEQTVIVDGSIAGIFDDDGNAQGYVVVMRDISDMKKLSASLDYQASHDVLTGLLNREGFAVRLEDVLDSVKRGSDPCMLMQIDMDHFSGIRAQIGEAGGNAVLQEITRLLQTQIERRDIPARVGADIFSLIILECTPEEAAQIAERLHGAVRGADFKYEGKSFKLTISIGLTQINNKAPFAERLIVSADAACMNAKKAGGNQTMAV